MPQTPLHEWIAYLLTYMLRMRYLNTNVSVFHDFIINWGIPGLANPSPDVSVIPDVPDPKAIEKDGVFFVKEQGTKPILVVEVVSPNYRKEDREQKVEIYERAGVREYLIFDFYSRRGRNRAEVLLYRLVQGRYRLQTPDEDGLLYCQTVDLRLGLDEEGKLFVEDGETGERLRTPEEEIAAREAAEAQAKAEAARAEAAEARLAEMEAELRRLRGEE
jgi:hypothetical protein